MGLYPPFAFSYIINDLAGLSENRKKFIHNEKNQYVLIAKSSFLKTQKIAGPRK